MSERETPDRWSEIDDLFARVLERPPEERSAFLENLRDVDERLRTDVERLLRRYEEAESFLEAPPALSPDTLAELAESVGQRGAPAATPGERIGRWRIVEELGRGGMATVYLVERVGDYRQTGALKLLRRGLDTDDIVRRFRAERQILSSLDHPNISRLLDGGATNDGRPYLVMEPVEGVPITDWCAARSISVDERLKLFADVARTVHHAHTKLVVHRDLKPSNILVTPESRVKLLDFGIAKILDPDLVAGDDVRTRTGRRTLTPEYASPEQVRGTAITTATDVYQLGLLLHRLLSGARPREARGVSATLAEDPTPTPTAPSRVARHVDETVAKARRFTPERLSRRLRGDLDAIVLAALETDPDRRYGSALGMAEDVERHLEGQPITARPAGVLYRARKFTTRHRWIAPVAAVAAIILGLYVATLVRHGNQLEVERNTAREEAEQAGQVRDVLVDVFRTADPWTPGTPAAGSEITVREALAKSTDRIREELEDQPDMRSELLRAIAGVYLNLGLPGSARPLLDEALAIDTSNAASSAASMRLLGAALRGQGVYDSAASLLRTSYGRLRSLRGPRDSVTLATGIELGETLKLQGRFEEARELFLRMIERLESRPTPTPELAARAHSGLAQAYVGLGREEEAPRSAERALSRVQVEFGDDDPRTGRAMAGLAWVLYQVDRFEEAADAFERAVSIFERSLGSDHAETMEARVLLSDVLTRVDRMDEAEEMKRRVLARQVELFGEDDERVIISLHQLSLLLTRQGELDEAERLARRVYDARVAKRPDHFSTGWPLSALCRIHGRRDEHAAAETACREALRIYRASLPTDHTTTAIAECHLGRVLARRDRPGEAAALFDSALPIVGEDPPQLPDPYLPRCLEAVVPVYESLGRHDDADRWRRRLAEVLESRE